MRCNIIVFDNVARFKDGDNDICDELVVLEYFFLVCFVSILILNLI